MSTQAAMIAEIQDDLERDDDTTIRNKITGAIRRYQSVRFWFNETRDITFNTVAGTQDYDFETDIGAHFYEIDGAFLTFGLSIIDLDLEDYRVIEMLRDATSTSSVPTRYAYINEALALYPEPDAAYSVRLTGHIRRAGPTTDNEAENVWMTDAYDLIMARAKVKLLTEVYQDFERAAVERTIESDALADLQGRTASKTGTGSISPTQF